MPNFDNLEGKLRILITQVQITVAALKQRFRKLGNGVSDYDEIFMMTFSL